MLLSCVGDGTAAVVVLLAADVDVVVVVAAGVETGASVVPTQYAYPAQNPVEQSSDTAGFHARNCAALMRYVVSTEAQESPSVVRCVHQ